MANNEKDPRVRRGPSEVDLRGSGRREDSAPGTGLQFSVLIARLPKNADEEVRISLDEFRGEKLLDIRIYASFTIARARMPTKRGISIPVEMLPDLLDALQDAVAKARKLSDGD
jgi:hypothetical protein